MIKHVVMWTLKDTAGGRNKSENLMAMKQVLEALEHKIEGIRHLEVGINFNASEDAYDLVLVSEFATRQDLETYQEHPEHVAARDFIRKVRLERHVVDYEI